MIVLDVHARVCRYGICRLRQRLTLVLRLACELNEFGEINVTEKRRWLARRKSA